MTKKELVEFVLTSEEMANIDFAIPLEFGKKCDELGIEKYWFVWNYNNNSIGGEPLNLLEQFAKKLEWYEHQ
jgi:hypothetical protein